MRLLGKHISSYSLVAGFLAAASFSHPDHSIDPDILSHSIRSADMPSNGIHSAPAADSPSTSGGTKSPYTTPPSALTSGDGRDAADMIGSGATGTKIDSPEANAVPLDFKIAAAIMANAPGEPGDNAQFASAVGRMTDPFVTSTTIKGKGKALAVDSPKGKYEQKLSATACCFTPSGNLTNFGNNTAKSLGSLFVNKDTITDNTNGVAAGAIATSGGNNTAVALTNPCVVNGSTPAVYYVKAAGVGGTALGDGSAAPMAPTFAGYATGKTVVGIVVLNYHPETVRADPTVMHLLNNFAVAKGRMGPRPDFALDRTVHGQLRVECFELPNLDEVSLFIRDQYPEWSLGDFNVTPVSVIFRARNVAASTLSNLTSSSTFLEITLPCLRGRRPEGRARARQVRRPGE